MKQFRVGFRTPSLGISIGDLSEASAIEYSVLVLRVANIVVCGHSECGAMKAVMANNPRPETPNLIKWLHHAHAAAFRLEHEGALDAKLKPHDQLSQINVLVQLEHLMSYAIVRDKVSAEPFDCTGGGLTSRPGVCARMTAQVVRSKLSTGRWPIA